MFLRKVLGDLINQVRFPLMTREEFAFAMQDPEARLINDQHIIDLFIHLSLDNNQCQSTNGASSSIMPKKQLPFSSKSRCCLRGVQLVINRFGQIDSRWGYSGTSDRVRFSVNRRIFIAGFGLFGSIYGKCEYSVVIKVMLIFLIDF
jgi:BTB/POZ domain-containing protein 1/2